MKTEVCQYRGMPITVDEAGLFRCEEADAEAQTLDFVKARMDSQARDRLERLARQLDERLGDTSQIRARRVKLIVTVENGLRDLARMRAGRIV